MNPGTHKWLTAQAPRVTLALLAGWAVLVANWLSPVVRFTVPVLNYLTMAVVFLLPLPAAVLATWLRHLWLRVGAWFLLAAPMAVGLLFAFFAFTDALEILRTGRDSSFEPTDAVPLRGTTLRAYQTDAGATTDFGFVVRQEKTIIPGVVVVRTIYSQYHAKGGRLEIVTPDSVRVIAHADGVDAPGPVLAVRRLLWE